MAFYDRMIALATRLIAKRGQPVKWVTVRNTENPAEPWNPGESVTTEYPGTMVAVVPTDRYTFESFRLEKNSDVQIGYEMGYMAQQPFEPNLKDTFVDAKGVTYTIEDMSIVHPDGRSILYILLLTR